MNMSILNGRKNAFGLPAESEGSALPIESTKKQLIDARKLLLEQKSEDVVKKVIQLALEDGNPLQGAMLKLCFDRMLPMSEFDDPAKLGTVIINITEALAEARTRVFRVIEQSPSSDEDDA